MVRPALGWTRRPICRSPAVTRRPVSSLASRTAASAIDSPGSTSPAMNVHGGSASLRRPASTPRLQGHDGGGYGPALGRRGVMHGRCLLEFVELAPEFVHVPPVLTTRRPQFRADPTGLNPAPERGGVDT